MARFKKGDRIIFTFKAMLWPERVPSDKCLDPDLREVGKGEIVCGPDSVSYYGVKVIEPADWRDDDNNLGGKLSGVDKGKGCFLHENAMMFDVFADKKSNKNPNKPQGELCPICGHRMTQGAMFGKYCTNNNCPTNQKNAH